MSSKILLNNEILLDNVQVCKSFWSKLRGFMFFRKPPYAALLLKNTQMIHMFFVFFKLAIVVLNKELVVLDKFIIKPWQVSKYYSAAEYFLEITDIAALDKINIGNKLTIKP